MSNALSVQDIWTFAILSQFNDDTDNSEPASPEEVKLTWDGNCLYLLWKTCFERHHDFNIYAMTADSGFDDVPSYQYLFENHGILPVIALNPRNTRQDFGKPGINENGIPTCPKDPSLPMKWMKLL